MAIDTFSRTVMILEDEAKYAIDLHGVLLQEGIEEIFTFHDNYAAHRWLGKHTPDIAIVDPRLRDGSSLAVVASLVKRGVPYIVYSEMRPGPGSWLAEGQWIAKPCIPHLMLSAVRFAITMRQVQAIARPLFENTIHRAHDIRPFN